MRINFCHHLSLTYFAGGEKWIISTAKELVKRGHDVEIYALPFLLDGKPKINPKEVLEDIPYTEGKRHKVKADVAYVTYNPLSFLNFETSRPRIAGIHSHTYWQNPHPSYGILPNVANLMNRFTSYFELRRFNAVHTVTNVYPVNHPKIYYIPNFVDSEKFKPCAEKDVDFTVAYASRKVWQKGWDIFNHIRKSLDPRTNFLISGEIPEEQMSSFFSKPHVTLVPSRVDTFGLTIVESMLCGTPVITSPLKTHKVLGLPLYYSESVSDYILTLKQLEKLWRFCPNSYDNLSKLCREFAMTYDKKIIIDKLENMFRETVNSANS